MDDNKGESKRPAQCPYRDEMPELFKPLATTSPTDERPHQHPFVTFKRFIDNQFAALTNLSTSSYKDWSRQMQLAREEVRQKEQDKYTRWTGRTNTRDHDDMLVQRVDKETDNESFDTTIRLLERSQELNAHTSPDKIAALYADDEFIALERDQFQGPKLSFGGACYYMSETEDNLPSTASIFGSWPTLSPRWLSIDWFKHSIYSPVNLEAETALSNAVSWRDAFEDLLNASLGKEMERRKLSGTTQIKRCPATDFVPTGPGLDWMLSLQCRGILPPQLPTLYQRGQPWHTRSSSSDINSLALEVRNRWKGLAAGWAPRSAQRDLSELVREVINPFPLPRGVVSDEPALTEMDVYESVPRIEPSWRERYEDEESSAFSQSYNPSELDVAREGFWSMVQNEETDCAAEIVRYWESCCGDVRDLIGDKAIVRAYLTMDTDSELWPLCEALEKADSQLYRQQALYYDLKRLGVIAEDHVPELEGGSELTLQEVMPLFSARLSEMEQLRQKRKHLQQRLDELEGVVSAHADTAEQTLALDMHRSGPSVTGHSNDKLKPAVLAALTTVHTTVLPDGTMTKKTVLKRRFADGKEETTESVEVEHPDAKAHNSSKEEKPKTKGWFWS